MRLIEDGRFGNHLMKLMVSQNAPFVPMYNAWREDSRDMLHYDDDKARRDVEIIDARCCRTANRLIVSPAVFTMR